MGRSLSVWIGLGACAGVATLMAFVLFAPDVLGGDAGRTATLSLLTLAAVVILIHALMHMTARFSSWPVLCGIAAIPVLAVIAVMGNRVAPAALYYATTSSLERNGVHFGRAEDGLFRPYLEVEGKLLRFVVDTEFEHVLLSPSAARRIGLDPSSLAFNVPIEGPDGPQSAASTTLKSIGVPDAWITDVPVMISAHELKANILGRAFFDRTSEWGIRGDVLIIAP